MDSLDVHILRAFFREPMQSPLSTDFRASLAAIAKQLGEDESTVRYRLRRIQESGFFADSRLFVNPHLWGGGHVSVWFDVDRALPKREIMEGLRLIQGVDHVTVTYDSLIAYLEFADERSLPRQIELIRRLAHTPEVFVARDTFPECRTPLGAREWDLIRALRKNPRKPYARLAAEIGLSSRTARVKLSKLTAEGAIFEWPSLNLRAVRGGSFILLFVKYPWERKPKIDETITAHLDPYLWHIVHMLPYRRGDLWPCGYELILPNLSLAPQILDWVKLLPGVEDARTYLCEDIVTFFEVYDEELDRKLGRMPTLLPAVRGIRLPKAAPHPRSGRAGS